MVIVGELHGWQELVPVVLLVVGEDADKLFELLVDMLRLAVGLQVQVAGLIPTRRQSSRVNSPMNCGPLSEMYFRGMPWCLQTFQ